MKFKPRKYQLEIAEFILSHPTGRVAIWAGMGLGKTSATLFAVNELLQRKDCLGPALIIAPLRVAQSTWPDEVRKWDGLQHLKVSVITGSRDAVKIRAIETPADIYTTNYEQLPWLVNYWGERWPYSVVVCDEATRLKSFRTRQGGVRTKALAKVAFLSPYFIELTGTPAPNGLLDLWGQIWFLDKGERLGASFSRYCSGWFYYDRPFGGQYGKWKPYDCTNEQVRNKLSDISITINAEDYFDLASNITNRIEVTLPADVMKMYRKFGRTLYLLLESGEKLSAVNAAVKTAKLIQIASGAVYLDEERTVEKLHDAKIDALKSVVEEASGMPVLCAYSFKHEVERILKAFPKARVLDKDPQTITDWNEGRIPLLLAHPASCGHGLNLQEGGNILVFFSCTWNLEWHDQIVERIGAVRQAQAGLNRPTFIHYLVAKDTIDEAVLERLSSKRELQDILLEKKNLLIGGEQ